MQLVIQIITTYVVEGDKVQHWVLGALVLQKDVDFISLHIMGGKVLAVVSMEQLRY